MNGLALKLKYGDHYIFHLKNGGLCRNLKGNIVAKVIFLDTPYATWNSKAKSIYMENYVTAIKKIVYEAKKCGVSLDIQTDFTDSSTNISNISCSNDWISPMLFSSLGISDPVAYQKKLIKDYRCDSVAIMFVLNYDNKRSFAHIKSSGTHSEEFCIVDITDSPDVIIHEFLHMYGAMDYYMPLDTEIAAAKWLPDTVMDSGSTIDPVTKYCVGWIDDMPENGVAFLEDTKHYTLDDFRLACMGLPSPKTKAKIRKPDIVDTTTKVKAVTGGFNSLKKSAESGNAYSCFLVGYCYSDGIETSKDLEQAIFWTEKAASAGLTIAKYSLACMLTQKKEIVRKDEIDIHNRLLAATFSGHIWAMNNFGSYSYRGKFLEKDTELGMKYLSLACEPCTSKAVMDEYVAACEYSKDIPALHKEMSKTVENYKYSSMYGDPFAQFTVGLMYQKGDGFGKDPVKAFELLTKSAQAKDWRACFELGYCYEYGIGTGIDMEKAKKYYALGQQYCAKYNSKPMDAETFKAIYKRHRS